MLKLSDFDYNLPKELIAQYPLKERDSSRLLVLNKKTGLIEHAVFKDICGYLLPGDLLILNDTKVNASRLIGSRLTGGKVEVLLLDKKEGLTFKALIKPARVRLGEKLIFNGGSVSCKVIGRNEVSFCAKTAEEIYDLGVMPLPPYIKRKVEESDALTYQTVYAKNPGAIASPTAGLHFTNNLFQALKAKGAHAEFVTLHVGYATFKPVKCDDVSQHTMEYERFEVRQDVFERIKEAKRNRRRIIAVGTTSLRVLEAIDFDASKPLLSGKTNLFIYPGHKFKTVDSLITNFHLPRTTLLMLASAFAGEKNIKKAYREALNKKYRFYSYGDAMFII